jgi:5-methylcytosine-specific restriction endonuclease McrA
MIRKRKVRSSNPFKPRYRRSRRERKRAEYAELRPGVREQAWERYGYRCIWPTCRIGLTLDSMHAHEVVFRSAGGSATDIANVVPTCSKCHGHIHVRLGGKLKRIETEGAQMVFYERVNGNAPWFLVGRVRFVAKESV